ncbi:MAG: TetR/AcrR family transcriptional regulator [Acidobacteria bacterium]|nr:TetR/AcrR family transcriptional regulator [Acidobacteriota bacterium]
MARPKQFDRDEALERAIEVFWEYGFEASSIELLLDRMGINRASLYDTFGDKQALYLEALGRYCATNESLILEILGRGLPVREKLREMYLTVVERACSENGFRGCFINNAMVERAAVDEKTAFHTSASIERIEHGLECALDEARKKGEIAAGLDPAALARFFYNNLQGLQVVGKTTRDRVRLEQIVKVALSVLD